MNLFSKVSELQEAQKKSALCTVVEVMGSTPRKAGAKMIVIDNQSNTGEIVGTIGGGAIEHHIRVMAIKALQQNQPQLIKTSLRNDLAMCCGGEMTIFIEPIPTNNNFICFGAGHIAQALCPLALALGFTPTIVDERKDLLNSPAFSNAKHLVDDVSIFSIKSLAFSPTTYVVVATHDHHLDQKILEGILDLPYAYLALVGSKRKKYMTIKRLQAKNYLPQSIGKIICPAGVDIKAQTPQEIALSIAAQMIEVKNNEAMRTDRSRRHQLPHGVSQGNV